MRTHAHSGQHRCFQFNIPHRFNSIIFFRRNSPPVYADLALLISVACTKPERSLPLSASASASTAGAPVTFSHGSMSAPKPARMLPSKTPPVTRTRRRDDVDSTGKLCLHRSRHLVNEIGGFSKKETANDSWNSISELPQAAPPNSAWP